MRWTGRSPAPTTTGGACRSSSSSPRLDASGVRRRRPVDLQRALRASRSLRVKLVGSDRQRCLRTLQIAAARGTTLTAETVYGLARAYESAGDRVLLVSGNLRKSSSRQLYDVPLAPGLGSYVTARGVGVKPFQVDGYEHLAAVPADRAGLRTNHLPTARELQPVFSVFRGLADVVITESGLVLAPDGLELATVADATVLVAVEGSTKSSDLRLAGRTARCHRGAMSRRRGLRLRLGTPHAE